MVALKNAFIQGLLAVTVAAIPLAPEESSLDVRSQETYPDFTSSALVARKNPDKCEIHIHVDSKLKTIASPTLWRYCRGTRTRRRKRAKTILTLLLTFLIRLQRTVRKPLHREVHDRHLGQARHPNLQEMGRPRDGHLVCDQSREQARAAHDQGKDVLGRRQDPRGDHPRQLAQLLHPLVRHPEVELGQLRQLQVQVGAGQQRIPPRVRPVV